MSQLVSKEISLNEGKSNVQLNNEIKIENGLVVLKKGGGGVSNLRKPTNIEVNGQNGKSPIQVESEEIEFTNA